MASKFSAVTSSLQGLLPLPRRGYIRVPTTTGTNSHSEADAQPEFDGDLGDLALNDMSHAGTNYDYEGRSSNDGVVGHGQLKYAIEDSANGQSYQEASGAPVEAVSPLGTHVGWMTVVGLNIGKMIGTGIFSTPASILNGTGSTGLSILMWVIGYIMAMSGMSVYMEFAAYFPNRSGAQTAYLEQAYPRPKYFFPAVFAFQTVLFSFSSSNAIVLSQYIFKMADVEPTAWQMKGVAVGGYTFAALLLVFSTKYSLWLSNAISAIKVVVLLFISITGFVVLAGQTRVQDPTLNYRHSFEGTSNAPYGITNALMKVVFAYSGYENAFNVVNEIKNPIKTLRKSAPTSITIVSMLFVLVNVAFFAAVPNADLKASNETAAALFFSAVFGEGTASRSLNILVVLCAFGTLITVFIGTSRVIRECGRQGVLPYPWFWASTKPFGTPLGPYFTKWFFTTLFIIAPPAGDAFNFIIDLAVYPGAVFKFLMGLGLFILRRRRSHLGLPRASYRAWDIAALFYTVINLFLLVMPWYPPPGGANGGDVSFWYATYVVVGIALLLLCGVYYWLWARVVPRWKGYRVRQEVVVLEGGARAHRLVKVPVEELEVWDAEHDAVGRKTRGRIDSGSEETTVEAEESDELRQGTTKTVDVGVKVDNV